MRQLTFALLCLLATSAFGGDVVPTARERFAAESAEAPDFQKHVVPLLSRLGCNGRACHGSFAGQGDFRLSLFGYDFKMDHEGLEQRVDSKDPLTSYALEKATAATPHKGGKRTEVGTWEYNLFLAWIKGGAKPIGEEPTQLERLEVTPSEIIFQQPGQQQQLKAVAVWADGTQEDVTHLCRFQANDPQVCEINKDGLIVAGEQGDTHVVAFYDMAVVPVPVLRPVSEQTGDKYPQVETPTRIDELVVEKLRKLGLVQSDVSDDAQFLRRVSLDMIGTLPTEAEVRAFSADSSPDKRAKKIDALLETPAYTAWMTTRLCDWTGNSDNQLNNVGIGRTPPSEAWYEWIFKRVSTNTPYDKLIEGIVLANSRKPEESYEDYCARECDRYRKEESYADVDGLTYFWGRKNFIKTEDRAIGFAYTFLGTRIQCAQCHKHPFDRWTQDDFKQFEAFFTRVRYDQNGGDREAAKKLMAAAGVDEKLKGNDLRKQIPDLIKAGKVVALPELHVTAPKYTEPRGKDKKKANAKRQTGPDSRFAKLLGGDVVEIGAVADPRQPLMDWMRSHPLFARAFVNRVWANYFHRGIVEPTDDLSLANPASNEALLDYLAKGFVESGFDMKWVHRTIANSRTYQTSWKPNATNTLDERNFSHAIPRRLPAEVATDAVMVATASNTRAQVLSTEIKGRMINRASPPRNNATNGPDYALGVFGRSARENNCDCDRSTDVSLLQTLYLRNDQELLTGIDRGKDGWLNEVSKELKLAFTASTPEQEKSKKDRKNQNLKRKQGIDAQLEKAEKQLAEAREKKDEKRIKDAEQRVEKVRAAMQRLAETAPAEDLKEESPAEVEARAVAQQEATLRDMNAVVESAYLRTLSRYPTDDERQISLNFIKDAPDGMSGLRDVFWALLNTKEFILNH